MCPRIDPCVLSRLIAVERPASRKGTWHSAPFPLPTIAHLQAMESSCMLVIEQESNKNWPQMSSNIQVCLDYPHMYISIYIVWYNYIYIIYWLYIVHHSSTMSEADKKKTAKIRTGWWFQPLRKIWVRQLGLLFPINMENHKIPWFQSPPTSKDKKLSQSWGFNSGRCHSKSPKRPYEKPPWGPSQRTYNPWIALWEIFNRKPPYLMVKTHGFLVKIFPNKPIHWLNASQILIIDFGYQTQIWGRSTDFNFYFQASNLGRLRCRDLDMIKIRGRNMHQLSNNQGYNGIFFGWIVEDFGEYNGDITWGYHGIWGILWGKFIDLTIKHGRFFMAVKLWRKFMGINGINDYVLFLTNNTKRKCALCKGLWCGSGGKPPLPCSVSGGWSFDQKLIREVPQFETNLLGGELPTNRKWVSSPQWLMWINPLLIPCKSLGWTNPQPRFVGSSPPSMLRSVWCSPKGQDPVNAYVGQISMGFLWKF